MANIKSAVKRIRIAKRNHKKNQFYKNKLKKLVKEAQKSVQAGKENLEEIVKNAVSWLDKTASKGIIKKNTASRKKSRLMKMAAKLKKK